VTLFVAIVCQSSSFLQWTTKASVFAENNEEEAKARIAADHLKQLQHGAASSQPADQELVHIVEMLRPAPAASICSSSLSETSKLTSFQTQQKTHQSAVAEVSTPVLKPSVADLTKSNSALQSFASNSSGEVSTRAPLNPSLIPAADAIVKTPMTLDPSARVTEAAATRLSMELVMKSVILQSLAECAHVIH
jgi:hypothetical protein